MNTLVSVVITTYNRPRLLERAIYSVLDQSYRNIELIISDDCSSYDVQELIDSCKEKSPFPIVYRCNERNSGACFSRNEAFKIAKGRYICGLDDDDEFTKNRVQLLVDNMNDRYSFVTSNTEVITKIKTFHMYRGEKLIRAKDIYWYNCIGTQVLVDKEKLLALNGFDTLFTSSQDADMWTRLLEEYGPALRLNEVTYLMHTEHDEERITTSDKKTDGLEAYIAKHKGKMSYSQIHFRRLQIKRLKNELSWRDLPKVLLDINLAIFIIRRMLKIT